MVGLIVVTVGPASADLIVAWGNDGLGEVSNAPKGPGFTAIAAGGNDALALTSNGSIVAWGDDYYSEVSNAPTGTGFTAIAAGTFTGYALTSNGSIVTWGDDYSRP